ncbi:MAG TPA: AMP-binding protein, partial [Burkholderiaceae bacterium]|nr:AMP-binding protein [Burkholderiaceae bacterium]
MPLHRLLAHAAMARPLTRLHFYTEAGYIAMTTSGLLQAGRQLARGLRAIGLKAGDTIAVQMPTQHETAVLYLAAFEIGAVLVPIVHIYGPAEVGFIVRQSRARLLAVPQRWRGIDFLERVEALGVLPELEQVLVLGERAPRGGITWQKLQQAANADAPTPAAEPVAPQETCVLLYTSGTTAAPKGVQ